MNDYNTFYNKQVRIEGPLPTDEVPFHITSSGAEPIREASKFNAFSETVQSIDSFADFAGDMAQESGEMILVVFDGDNVVAKVGWPKWGDRKLKLSRELTEEGRAWLRGIETVKNPKDLAEFIEDYGFCLDNNEEVFRQSALNLVHALRSIKVSGRSNATIEYRNKGDRVEMSVSRDAESSTDYELPTELHAAPQLYVGDPKAFKIKVRVNYMVTGDSDVSVRCKVSTPDAIVLRAKEVLAEDLIERFDDHENIRVVV